jgi:quercetin dioxygenase-like cupin family protein
MFGFRKDASVTNCEEGVKRRVLSHGGHLMMCEVAFEKGAVGLSHTHPHEQISYVAEGTFSFTVDGETQTVSRGDSVYIPSGAEHGVRCLEEGKLVDVFSPIREEFL